MGPDASQRLTVFLKEIMEEIGTPPIEWLHTRIEMLVSTFAPGIIYQLHKNELQDALVIMDPYSKRSAPNCAGCKVPFSERS